MARAACTSLDQNSDKETFRDRVVPWVGFKDYTYQVVARPPSLARRRSCTLYFVPSIHGAALVMLPTGGTPGTECTRTWYRYVYEYVYEYTRIRVSMVPGTRYRTAQQHLHPGIPGTWYIIYHTRTYVLQQYHTGYPTTRTQPLIPTQLRFKVSALTRIA